MAREKRERNAAALARDAGVKMLGERRAMTATKPRILAVDDEAPQVQVLCRTLPNHGYEPVGFTDGEAAVEYLRGAESDLLLADLMMPAMDGIALLQAAQEIEPSLLGSIMTGAGALIHPMALVAAVGAATVLSFEVLSEYVPRELAGRANGALSVFHIGGAFVLAIRDRRGASALDARIGA